MEIFCQSFHHFIFSAANPFLFEAPTATAAVAAAASVPNGGGEGGDDK